MFLWNLTNFQTTPESFCCLSKLPLNVVTGNEYNNNLYLIYDKELALSPLCL